MGSIESPFSPTGLQPAIAERDQRIAVLEYQLRCIAADLERERTPTLPAGTQRLASTTASSLTSWLGSDEEGQPITPHERRTLNALVRRYMLARGYKATSVSFAEEAGGSFAGASPVDAALSEAELDLIALPRAQGTSGGGGRAVLSLLGMHRKRITPIQQLVESEARNDSTISALRAEVRALQEQLDLASADLAAAKDRAAQVRDLPSLVVRVYACGVCLCVRAYVISLPNHVFAAGAGASSLSHHEWATRWNGIRSSPSRCCAACAIRGRI
jgi:phosphoenolpyruvate carboxylase